MSAIPPLRVDPGWYWWLIMPQDIAAYSAFHRANAKAMKVRKVFRGQYEANEIVLFEVTEPLAWTLVYPPSKAPKAFRTELDDIIKAPAPSPHWAAALSEFVETPARALKETSSALRVLLWGGAAIVLLNLFRSSRPGPPESAA